MRETEQTPLPWHVYDRGIGWEVHGPTNETITQGFRDTMSKADAELIVRAVNAHAELLSALEDITNEAAHVDHDHWNDWVARLQSRVITARAAIAKAGS